MSFRAGQTFLFPLSENSQAHLWVIATAPSADGTFAVVSLTSLKGSKDQTVILRAAEHPFVKWDTCVHYALAEISNSEKLTAYLNSGSAKMHQDIDAKLLALILDGFAASDFTKRRVRDFVRDYKLAAIQKRLK